MTTLNLSMNWGTFLHSNEQSSAHGGLTYMEVGGSGYQARPLMKFDYNGIPGAIQSASLNFYVTNTGGSLPLLRVWRITRESTVNATWLTSPITAWHAAGAENMNNDRYQTPLTAQYQITTTGWHSVPITDLEQLAIMLGGLKTLLIREEDSRPQATISKTTAPYIAIEYKSSLVGGVQII